MGLHDVALFEMPWKLCFFLTPEHIETFEDIYDIKDLITAQNILLTCLRKSKKQVGDLFYPRNTE